MSQALIIIIAAVFLSAICGATIAWLVGKKRALGRAAKIFVGFGAGIVLFCLLAFGYLSLYSPAESWAYERLASDDMVAVTETENGYRFDGLGDNENALVFYPGAKVDEAAYAPLLRKIAEQGVDCFLVRMPFHMAIFGGGSVVPLMEDYDYDNWYMAGHSMGGMVAASDTSDHEGRVRGVVLLASYPTKDLNNQTRLLSLRGTEDMVLSATAYEDCRGNWPDDSIEIIIEGGNHAQFGCYGKQSDDGDATISAEEQQEITAEEVVSFIANDSR